MFVARILYPVQVLGPGNRVGIWVSGCPRRCEGCANPELWVQNASQNISVEDILDLVSRIASNNTIDGFTITGGEPFFQHDALEKLVEALTKWSEDIIVFSGYERKEIESFASLANIAVLIDGPYVQDLNEGLTLRGSKNQTIHLLKSEFKDRYDLYLKDKNSKIQNFFARGSVISVGIHRPDYAATLDRYTETKGLIVGGNEHESVHTEMAQRT